MATHRLYLRLGDRVLHREHEEWGEGVVTQEMTSILEGGTCLVRVRFADGRERTFHNDLDSERCCYFFGLRKQLDGPTIFFADRPSATAGRRRLR